MDYHFGNIFELADIPREDAKKLYDICEKMNSSGIGTLSTIQSLIYIYKSANPNSRNLDKLF